MQDFQRLNVYILSKDLAKQALGISERIKFRDAWLASQIKRACFSICLNIAEGSGRLSPKDKKHFYVISRSSAYECVALTEILNDCNLISFSEFNELNKKFDTISKMLYGLIRSEKRS